MVSLLKSFIKGNDIAIINKVPPTILRSWERCRTLSVNHEKVSRDDALQLTTLKELLQINTNLILAAKPILRYIFNILKGKNYLLVISDKEGYVLETFGEPTFINKTAKIYLYPGVNWREDLKGTNGVGTVIIEQIPINIPGWAHYSQPVSFLDCWAYPIRLINGELIGVLNISGEAKGNHKHMMEIASIGASMIEKRLQLFDLKEKFKFCREKLDTVGRLILNDSANIDEDGIIIDIDEKGTDLLGYENKSELVGIPLDDSLALRNNYFIPRTIFKKAKLDEHKPQWYGRSPKTLATFELAVRAARTDSTVLIEGESGTGKEIIARNIHNSSLRADKPFITLNCAAIPENLVESELFGYAEGAFTGARKGGQPGKFEMANGGTIFLDEIGDMPINVQASLLRVLQQKEFYRIGESKNRKIDVRVVAATNQDLCQLVEQGKFRLDLYYRLKVIFIAVPPLRDRVEDIWDLVPYFVNKFCSKFGQPALKINPDLYQYLISNPWPGNVRQLENCIESMVALSYGSSVLTVDDLPNEYKNSPIETGCNMKNRLLMQSSNLERRAILQVLEETNGNVSAAARKLGIGRTTLYRKMEKLLKQ